MTAPQHERPALLTQDPAPSPKPPAAPERPHWLGYLAALCLVGGGIAIGRFLPRTNAPTPVAASRQNLPPRAVETVPLTQGDGTQAVRLLGQVAARSSTVVRPRTDGTVRDIFVQSGDRVRAGMLLARLDDADQQLALSQARARLAEAESELTRLEAGTRQEIVAQRRAALAAAKARESEARDNLDRTRNLTTAGALSRRTLIEVESQVDAARGSRLEAEAALAEAVAGPRAEDIATQRAIVAANRTTVEQAQLALQRTEIRAATDGTVGERIASSGDYLEVGDPVLTLVGGNTLDIFLEVPEALGSAVAVGMPVTLASRALPGWQLQAPITAIVPTADATSRQQRVRVQLDNPPEDLVPGMAVRGETTLPIRSDGFVVPRDALTARGSRRLVYVADAGDDTVRELEIEVLADMGAQVAIAHPQLQSGQRIVVQGGDGLRDGASINAIPVTP